MAPRKKTLPNPLPDGWILTDTEKKQWRLGKIIGRGGFGLIYLASQSVDAPVRDDADFVIKVEYHENGPLFSELKFYQRAAKPDSMRKWTNMKRLDFLGIPAYWGSGLSEYNGTRYRFMVMDRLGTDLQKVCLDNGGRLKKATVLQLGVLLLDVLEYIHDNEYVHADIKAANLLLGYRDPGKVYLCDYGLCYRYCPDGLHKEYKENPKKGHNGTIEYTSIDAHNGVAPSRRGDMEVLGYCLLHWLCGTLPWLPVLSNPSQVQEAKTKLMADLPASVTQLSAAGSGASEVARFLLCVKALGYKERPDYQTLKAALSEGGPRGPLDLRRPRGEPAGPAGPRNTSPAKPAARRAARPKPVVVEDDDEEPVRTQSHRRTRAEPKPHEQPQKTSKAKSAAKGTPRPKHVPAESDEDLSDEEEATPAQVHPRKRAGSRQRQEQKKVSQTKRVTMETDPDEDEPQSPTQPERSGPETRHRWRLTPTPSDRWQRHGHAQSNHWARPCTKQHGYWEKSSGEYDHWQGPGHQSNDHWEGSGREYDDWEPYGHIQEDKPDKDWSFRLYATAIVVLLLLILILVALIAL